MELTASNMAILTSAASRWLRGAGVDRAMTSTAFESQSTMTLAKGAEAGQASANPKRSFRRIADMGSLTNWGAPSTGSAYLVRPLEPVVRSLLKAWTLGYPLCVLTIHFTPHCV